jgi:hypothetical protein
MAGGVVYVTNPLNGETVTPWLTGGSNYPDTEICNEISNLGRNCSSNATGWYTTTAASSTYAASPVLAWKWTRITEKTNKTSSGTTNINTVDGVTTDNNELVCFNGTNEVTTTQSTCALAGFKQVYVFTTLAVTPSGSRRMLQMEAAPTIFPTIPGAMVFDGSSPTYGAPNSNAFNVIGTDVPQGPTGAVCPAAVNEPAVGGFDAASVTALTTDLGSRSGNYTGGVSNVNSALGTLATVQGLNALVSAVTMSANPANVYSGNNPTIVNPGTVAAPVINVVQGDLSGVSGAGILLVEGNLTMSGTPSFNGLILVIGKGSVTKNGGGNGTLDGSLMVANLYNSSGTLITSGAPGTPTINWNGGGNATMQYDSCWSNYYTTQLPYRSLGVREMMY